MGVFLCLLAIGETSCYTTDRVVLSDRSAHSVAIARDIPTFKILLAARPSYAWKVYFSYRIAGRGGGLENELAALASGYAAARNAGMIVWLPNGTLASFTGETIIHGVGQADPLHSGFAEAMMVRVEEGPNRGLYGWTIDDVMQHQGSPMP
jgi:hypothetical protein